MSAGDNHIEPYSPEKMGNGDVGTIPYIEMIRRAR
jgi:hypothetical protein